MTKNRLISSTTNNAINVNSISVGNTTTNVFVNATHIAVRDTLNTTQINNSSLSTKSIFVGTQGSAGQVLTTNSTAGFWKPGPVDTGSISTILQIQQLITSIHQSQIPEM